MIEILFTYSFFLISLLYIYIHSLIFKMSIIVAIIDDKWLIEFFSLKMKIFKINKYKIFNTKIKTKS